MNEKRALLPALFLDRDGVINHDAGYTSRVENFQFIDGIFDLCHAATQAGYLLIVVTNQAGIGRGYYSEDDFLALTAWMSSRFNAEGAPLTEVLYCPFHPEHGIGDYKKESYDRKPSPGMLIRAAQMHGIDMNRSIMIGDKDSDMQAARAAGVGIRCHFMAVDKDMTEASMATHQLQSLRQAIALLNS